MEIESLARKAEKESNWLEAERLWNSCGKKEDASACRMIYQANSLGESYLSMIDKILGNYTWEEYITKYGEVGLDKLLREAHDEVYVNPYINQRNG